LTVAVYVVVPARGAVGVRVATSVAALKLTVAGTGVMPACSTTVFELIEDAVSLETPVGDGESLYSDLIEDVASERPDAATAERLQAVELHEALQHLKPRLRNVLERRFGLDEVPPQTLEEVGRDLGITRERVRQLEARALRELRTVAPDLHLYLQSE